MDEQLNEAQNQTVIFSILYHLDDAPLIPIFPTALSEIKERFSFHHYYCPFNTSVPLLDFDKTMQLFAHFDGKVGADLDAEGVLSSPPREIRPLDVVVTTFKDTQTRTVFLLLSKLSDDDYRLLNDACSLDADLELYSEPLGDRFHALALKGELDGVDILPDLLDTSYRGE